MNDTLKRQAYRFAGGQGVLATADPSDIGWTLPRRRINELSSPMRVRLHLQFFPVGTWDLHADPFDIHRYVRELFVDGVPVRQSEQYRDMVARVMDPTLGGDLWGCRTLVDVERYFEDLFAVFEDMRAQGYRPHTDLGSTPHDEVKVRIGRDGRLIKGSGGNHRVSFAKLLGIERIPVLVCGVHRMWLRRLTDQYATWDARVLRQALESAGLAHIRDRDVEQMAGRLWVAALLRTGERGRRRLLSRQGLAEGSWAVASLYDDLHALQLIFVPAGLPI